MSEGRPRRAAASNKAWAPLMGKQGHEGEEDFGEETAAETPKAGVKRSASKEQASTPAGGRGRKKKTKFSESGETDTELSVSAEQIHSPSKDVKPVIKAEIGKPNTRSPKKLLPSPKGVKVPTPQAVAMPHGNDNVEMIHQDFDRHQADLAEKMEEGDMEEEELVPADRKTTKIPPKSRGRPSVNSKPPPPSMTGMDDPDDEDYEPTEEETKPSKKRPVPRPRQQQPPQPTQISPVNRTPIYRPAIRPQTLVVRQTMPPVASRVVYPNRFPTIINGGPRVVQPRYISQSRNVNPASLRQPVNSTAYETPQNVLKDIEKLTEDCKKVSSPEVVSAFQLVELLRDEMERMHAHIRESNHYYKNFIEDLQAAAHSQFESSQNRTNSLEQRITSLETQLKKCSAVAHQKLLKTAVEGFRTNVSEHPSQPVMSPPKAVPAHQYVMMEGESSGMEQPRDYLVQEEDYQVAHPGNYYAHDAVIQEAAKDVDSML